MLRPIFSAAAAALAAVLCVSSAHAATLRVGVKETPPFATEKLGEWTGFTFDVLDYCSA